MLYNTRDMGPEMRGGVAPSGIGATYSKPVFPLTKSLLATRFFPSCQSIIYIDSPVTYKSLPNLKV